jgi:hypothetical protein
MKIRRSFIITGLVCLMNSSMIVGDEQADVDNSQPISVCDICSNPNDYDGRRIIITGVFKRIFHGSILEGCESYPKSEINVRLSPDYRSEKSVRKAFASLTRKNQYAPVEVVARGVFRAAKQGECFGQICAIYDIEVNEMLSAKPFHRSEQTN